MQLERSAGKSKTVESRDRINIGQESESEVYEKAIPVFASKSSALCNNTFPTQTHTRIISSWPLANWSRELKENAPAQFNPPFRRPPSPKKSRVSILNNGKKGGCYQVRLVFAPHPSFQHSQYRSQRW
jgi:hypothetical protein